MSDILRRAMVTLPPLWSVCMLWIHRNRRHEAMKCPGNYKRSSQARRHTAVNKCGCKLVKSICRKEMSDTSFPSPPLHLPSCEGISSSMNFDEEDDDEDEISSSSSQLNSNTRPGSATSKKSCKVRNRLTKNIWLLETQICFMLFHFYVRFSSLEW